MDDKAFIAEYFAKETARINERLKAMVNSDSSPSDEVRDSVIEDIETTLRRLQSSLSYILTNIDEDTEQDNLKDKKYD